MKLIPLVSIGISRDGQPVRPAIGKPFDFTDEEKADLDAIFEDQGVEAYRLPVNEAVEAPVALTAAEKKAAKKKTEEAL